MSRYGVGGELYIPKSTLTITPERTGWTDWRRAPSSDFGDEKGFWGSPPLHVLIQWRQRNDIMDVGDARTKIPQLSPGKKMKEDRFGGEEEGNRNQLSLPVVTFRSSRGK